MQSATEDVKENQKFSYFCVALCWIVGKKYFSNVDKVPLEIQKLMLLKVFLENSESPPGGNMIGKAYLNITGCLGTQCKTL